LKSLTATNIVHVPYKGVETALKAMLGGEVDFVVIGIPASARHVQAGALRGLAILGKDRVSALPDVPTAKEAGFGGLEVETWYGILTTAGVPRDVLVKLNRDLREVLQSPEMKQRLGTLGIEPTGSSPEEFAAFLKSETARWAKVVKDAGAKVD
jgi:tripartite-type tricarboxylate transporter receptor subunit TctC